ncbi:hypothetical protein Hanom_Chr12g01103541 [Helianthus anomalus]
MFFFSYILFIIFFPTCELTPSNAWCGEGAFDEVEEACGRRTIGVRRKENRCT